MSSQEPSRPELGSPGQVSEEDMHTEPGMHSRRCRHPRSWTERGPTKTLRPSMLAHPPRLPQSALSGKPADLPHSPPTARRAGRLPVPPAAWLCGPGRVSRLRAAWDQSGLLPRPVWVGASETAHDLRWDRPFRPRWRSWDQIFFPAFVGWGTGQN